METITRPAVSLPQHAPYDPADSPGPIPSVVERFRPRPYDPNEPDPDSPAAKLARHTVILVPPEHAEALGHFRSDSGLKLYVDDEWECDLAYLDEAITIIEEECGVPVTLVEHRSDLTYWTARPRDPRPCRDAN